ncbi:MAG: enoyl-CoA hydratase/isomerase family protein [Chloroflexi bacterium]|nr:enoyl-CoA hydratase/isomerase family protein [Chloroflexota bacterium]
MLQVTERDRIVFLTVPAPLPLGPASARLAWSVQDACDEIEQRDEPVAAVVLASGSGAFWLEPPTSAADLDALGSVWADMLAALDRLSPPLVACLGGDAVGPAWELALACDLRLASANARVGSPEIRWGRLPVAGGIQRLVRAVGSTLTTRLLLLGEVVTASEALALGLVHRVATPADLTTSLDALLEPLRTSAPIALAYAREAIRSAPDLPLAAGLRLEADLAALLQTTADRAEGLSAFLARRPPRFEAR